MTPRTLLLVRHAEAGHAPPGATDRERALSAHGRAQASAIEDPSRMRAAPGPGRLRPRRLRAQPRAAAESS